MNDHRDFNVGHQGLRADGVEVTLHEFAISSPVRVLASPHWSDVITFEGCPKLIDMLSTVSCQRNGQIESHPDLSATGVLEAIHLTIRFVTPFARQDLQVLQCGRIDRRVAERAIDLLGRIDDLLPLHHCRR